MKYIVFISCVLIYVQYGQAVMSEKQLAATKKLIRNTCTNKIGIAADKVEGLYKGNFDFSDKNLMCYMHCVLMTYKLMRKDNTFDWEEGIKVLEANAPPSITSTAVPSFKNCKNAVQSKESKCKAAFEIAKCLYDDDPAHYFLP